MFRESVPFYLVKPEIERINGVISAVWYTDDILHLEVKSDNGDSRIISADQMNEHFSLAVYLGYLLRISYVGREGDEVRFFSQNLKILGEDAPSIKDINKRIRPIGYVTEYQVRMHRYRTSFWLTVKISV